MARSRQERLRNLDNLHVAARECLLSRGSLRALPEDVRSAVTDIADTEKFADFRSLEDDSLLDSHIGYDLLREVGKRIADPVVRTAAVRKRRVRKTGIYALWFAAIAAGAALSRYLIGLYGNQ